MCPPISSLQLDPSRLQVPSTSKNNNINNRIIPAAISDSVSSDAASTSSLSSFSSVDTALSSPDLAPSSSGAATTTTNITLSSTGSDNTISDLTAMSGSPNMIENEPVSPHFIHASDHIYTANDDSVIQYEPARHVDYLSHNWKESDISSSWRYIVLRRKDVANSARLENASWRTWTKAKYNLRTVSPESVNWLKDYDVTWLYGPLAIRPSRKFLESTHNSPTSNEVRVNLPSPPVRAQLSAKKPILKKRSMSEVMLSRSISSSNLLKQAAASVKAQQHLRAPGTNPTTSQYSSTPMPYAAEESHDPRLRSSSIVARSYAASNANFSDRLSGEKRQDKPVSTKHIHFNNRVEQCIALEAKDDDDYNFNSYSVSASSSAASTDDEGEDEPGLFFMVRSASGSFQRPASIEPHTHTIAKLPSTTLKYVSDSPEDHRSASFSSSSNLSRLPSAYFSMGQDDDDDDENDDGDIEDVHDENDDYYISHHKRPSYDEPPRRYEDHSHYSISSKSSSSNLSDALNQAAKYVEDHSVLSDDSDDDGDQVVDMDSNLMASLRRDSVVLARGRISDFQTSTLLSPNSDKDNEPSAQHLDNSSMTDSQSTITPVTVTTQDSIPTISSSSSLPSSFSSAPPSASSATPATEPLKLVDSDEEFQDGDELIEEPQGIWSNITSVFSATKDLANLFWTKSS
ncbi:hypothetical protein V1514DRAFT_370007 [Lipomyces japonicus]|uniref:uncharacterized protein n=1 Tax=Lipomyces japonicus TaxID=56871 RepID=UPI0034CD3460